MVAPTPSPALLLGGLSLEQYAGVTAALAEGFDLTDILEQEGIAAGIWSSAQRAWIEAIVAATDLQLQLAQKRRIAEDCLGRAMPPLDDDPAAWTGLLGALATADDPASISVPLGISMADLARLGRRWKRKMEDDPELGGRIAALAATAQPPKTVQAEPRRLAPFPWTPSKEALAADAKARRMDALAREMGVSPTEVKGAPSRRLASFQLKQQASAVAAMPDAAMPAAATPAAATPAAATPHVPMPAPLPAPMPDPRQGGVAGGNRRGAHVGQRTAGASSDAPIQPAIPFETLEPEAQGISLIRYAELVTLLQQPGADTDAVLGAWGLDAEKRRALDDHYHRKFAREARWANEFGKLMAEAQKAAKERAPKPAVPELSVEQYAWVTATLRKTPPEQMGEVLARLRLSPQTRGQLDARWQARMGMDPALRETWRTAVDRHLFASPPPATPARSEASNALSRYEQTAPESPDPPAPSTPFVKRTDRTK